MTDQQAKFLQLARQYENLRKEMKELKPVLHGLMAEIGVNSHFQDLETRAVYQIVVPTGTFITFDPIGYNRTKLEGDTKGTLSMKKAEEMGYNLK